MIRRALEKDAPKICDLLAQVNEVHYKGRPDIFKLGLKYSVEEVKDILKKEENGYALYEVKNTYFPRQELPYQENEPSQITLSPAAKRVLVFSSIAAKLSRPSSRKVVVSTNSPKILIA